MKRKILLLFIVLLVLVFAKNASAHSGRTDGKGGHYDHSTGEYHYHHGYPAHDHKDIDGDGKVDCPYKFDDQTNQNSGAGGNSGHTTQTTPKPTTKPTTKPETSTTEKTTKIDPLVLSLLIIFAPFFIFLLMMLVLRAYVLLEKIKGKKQKTKNQE